eukprot:scaffold93139_cov63-Phaeocystis_antarctica.AAC.1
MSRRPCVATRTISPHGGAGCSLRQARVHAAYFARVKSSRQPNLLCHPMLCLPDSELCAAAAHADFLARSPRPLVKLLLGLMPAH